jgi:FKBP-type peptidyl-prolyl cis-trans isomerase
MNKRIASIAMAATLIIAVGLIATRPLLADDEASTKEASYALGFILGERVAQTDIRIDYDAFLAGVVDAVARSPSRYTPEQTNAILKGALAVASARRLSADRAFLEANGKRPEVVTTSSGLQYQVVKEGTGKTPRLSSIANVRYTGSLVDGAIFDRSPKDGAAIDLPLSSIIAGLSEGLQLMKEGAVYRFWIPTEMAYGVNGSARVPSNAALVFEIELVKVWE